ncbi:MAG: hypothetical protein ACT4QA_07180 [Panacagrimonas sp.]
MSEYQYYEFQALDRPLTDAEMRMMRGVSTRATITATRFVNHYEWGNFKGDVREWMRKYFDAFVHVANWGTREFMLRLPRRSLDPELARRYCVGEAASVRVEKDVVILSFDSEDDEGDEEWDEGSGWLSALVPLRADLARGDHRALYLAWLSCAQHRELDDDAAEPPVPPGLATLSAPLRAMADFLRIDRSLIAAAAERSAELTQADPPEALAEWIAALPVSAKDDWLLRLTRGEELQVRAELLGGFRESHDSSDAAAEPARTAAALLDTADRVTQKRRKAQAQKAAAEAARREREQAALREAHLQKLSGREPELWNRIETRVSTKRPKDYDAAIAILVDLRELAERRHGGAEFSASLARFRQAHVRKQSLSDRMARAGFE